MERWLKKGTLKRSSAELNSSASDSTNSSFAKDNDGNNESAANEIAPKEVRPIDASTSNQPRAVTKKIRKYDERYMSLTIMIILSALYAAKFSQIALWLKCVVIWNLFMASLKKKMLNSLFASVTNS